MKILKSRRWLTIAATLAALLWAASASADVVYTLNDGGSAFSDGNFGTVTLQQLSATEVQLTVALNPNPFNAVTPPAYVVFANTGAGFPLSFNFAGDPDVVITPVTPGFDVPSQTFGRHPRVTKLSGTSGLNWMASPFGDFNYAVGCASSTAAAVTTRAPRQSTGSRRQSGPSGPASRGARTSSRGTRASFVPSGQSGQAGWGLQSATFVSSSQSGPFGFASQGLQTASFFPSGQSGLSRNVSRGARTPSFASNSQAGPSGHTSRTTRTRTPRQQPSTGTSSSTGACPTGGGSGNSSGPLVVDVTFSSAISLADFMTLSSGGNPGAFFGVDISIAGATGVVGATGQPTTTSVPEPTTLLLFASGAAGLTALRRRKKKAA